MSNIVFDDSAKSFILEAFGKSLNSDGNIIETNTGLPVIARDGSTIPLKRFAGVRKGSEVYIKSDLISLIELCDDLKKNS